jgi:hypothetical protein
MATVKIGCKLPHGLELAVGETKVTLNGANQHTIHTRLIGEYGVTDVDASFWAEWLKTWADSAMVKSGSVFEAKDEASVKAKAKDQGKTGFEQLEPDSNGVKTDKD